MEIQSTTQKGVVYETTTESCTCKGFYYTGNCKHVKELKQQ